MQTRKFPREFVGAKYRKGDPKTYLKTIVCPRSELHDASLFIEGEVFDINFTAGLVYRWRLPLHKPVVLKRRLSGECYFEVAVRAARGQAQRAD